MKLTQLNPKHLLRSKKPRSRSVSRSEPPSFSSGSSSSSSDLKAGSTTPTTVLRNSTDFSDISSEIHLDLIQSFKLMDKDNDGKITRRELETLLTRVGADPITEEEISLMLRDVDREGGSDGCIRLEKLAEIGSGFPEPAGVSEIRDAFDCFDADRDGKISAEELMGVFIAIGDDKCTLDDCRRMIAGVDSDGDGFVCFEDFAKMMEHQRC